MIPYTEPNQPLDLGGGDGQIVLQRLLVLEDDPNFQALLREYLESVPFEVVAVNNGVEGLKAVMAQKFDAIICDMLMPTLPGDMFYRAVERTKPELCRRFIFITGFKGNPKIDDFIRSIKGTILQKPFHMGDLRETISFTLSKR